MKENKLTIIGFVIIVAGAVYNVAFLGIPFPDPTPETIVLKDTYATIAGILCGIGFVIYAIGVLLRIVKNF